MMCEPTEEKKAGAILHSRMRPIFTDPWEGESRAELSRDSHGLSGTRSCKAGTGEETTSQLPRLFWQ